MKQRELAELFERFRAHGDAEALGEAFDRTAGDLRGLARHLARNRDDADDLVQATYLTAVEKARLLAPGREPMPWLVSILTLHARNLRRKRGRAVDPAELRRSEPTPPDVELERREFEEQVRRAIAELPERYSAVLAPYLGDQGDTRSIARATKRSEGAVRMQLHRGLERLRRSLAKAAPLGAWIEARQLAELKGKVLERAAAARGEELALPRAASRTLAAPLAGSKLALLALLATLTVTAGWWVATSASPAAADSTASGPTRPASSAAANAQNASTTDESARTESTTTSTVRAELGALAASAPTAGVRGRLLHSDGSPAAGVEVRLAAVQSEWLEPDDLLGANDGAQLERSRCTTDPEGGFLLPGARRGELLALAIDCGGPLGALRRIDGSPDAAGELRVGDVQLAATVEVSGRAIDADGEPLAGVLVRAVPPLASFSATFGADAFAMQRNGAWILTEVPEWIRTTLASLPTPTVRSAGDGAFRLRVAGARTSLHLRAPGFEPRTLDDLDLAGGPVQLGDVALAPGRRVSGRVVDAAGAPVVGAEVLVGVGAPAPRVSLALSRCAPTDAKGRFESDGVVAQGKPIVAARRASTHAWTFAEFDTDELEFVLPAPLGLELALLDTSGAPLGGVDVRLAPNAIPGSQALRFARPATLDRRLDNGGRIENFAAGNYALVASKPGYCARRVDIVLSEANTGATVEMAPARSHTVLVRDSVRGAALEGARVVAKSKTNVQVLARGVTKFDGTLELALPLALEPTEVDLAVNHPGFAPRVRLELGPAGAVQEIELTPGGAIALRVLERGAPVATRFTLVLRGPERSAFPFLATTEADGTALVTELAPARWRYELTRPWSALDGWTTFRENEAPLEVLHEGSVAVVEGEVTQLTLELDASHWGGATDTARLRGQFHLVGVEPARVAVEANFQGKPFQHLERQLDDRGRFDFGWIPAGRYYFELKYGKGSMAEIAGSAWSLLTTLEAGEERVLDIQIERSTVSVSVVDEAGERIEGASFWVEDPRGRRTSSFLETSGADSAGEALVHAPGSYAAVAEHPTLGYVRKEFEVVKGATETAIECRLERGRRVAGFVRAPAEMLRADKLGDRSLSLSFLKQQTPKAPHRSARVAVDESGRGAFSIVGLAPGTYRVHLNTSTSVRAEPLDILVGDTDRLDLQLEFVLKTGG
jgi:RNA polymerase sigma-70 factor (ECF subfamily)